MCVCPFFRKFSESGIDSTESTVNRTENECNFVSYLKLFVKEKFTHKAHQLQVMVVAWATFFTQHFLLLIVNSLLSGSFLSKFYSLSAPTSSRCGFVAQWLERSTRILQDPGFDSRQGCAVFFRLIRLSVLLSLSELKENRIWYFTPFGYQI